MNGAHDLHGVGLGWRPALASDLLRHEAVVDFVEVIAESLEAGSSMRREVTALARVWPVIPHGVSLSLGSVDFDAKRARSLAKIARDVKAPFVSEHISFVRAGGVEIGHLTALPRTHEAVEVVAKNARALQRMLDAPLLLENIAWSVRCPGEMSEPAFIEAVLAESGCGLLLDVANLYANATNEGLAPAEVLAAFPLEKTALIHVAGSVVEDGFVYDTHAHAVPAPVYALVEHVLARVGPRPILLERDRGFDFADHVRELAKLRALVNATATSNPAPRSQHVVAGSNLRNRNTDAVATPSLSPPSSSTPSLSPPSSSTPSLSTPSLSPPSSSTPSLSPPSSPPRSVHVREASNPPPRLQYVEERLARALVAGVDDDMFDVVELNRARNILARKHPEKRSA